MRLGRDKVGPFFIERVGHWLDYRSMSWYGLAKASGVEQSTFTRLRNGEAKEPTVDTVLRCCAALQCEVFDLLPTLNELDA